MGQVVLDHLNPSPSLSQNFVATPLVKRTSEQTKKSLLLFN